MRGGSLRRRWNTGCAVLDLDYDRGGRLDLFVANHIDFDLHTVPVPEDGTCRYKGVPAACGSPGLDGGRNTLFRNNGNGRFADVSCERLAANREARRPSGHSGRMESVPASHLARVMEGGHR